MFVLRAIHISRWTVSSASRFRGLLGLNLFAAVVLDPRVGDLDEYEVCALCSCRIVCSLSFVVIMLLPLTPWVSADLIDNSDLTGGAMSIGI